MGKSVEMTERHEAIKKLIEEFAIEDQLQLIDYLLEKYGIKTNQAVVSRDLRTLGISKKKLGDKMIYEINQVDVSRELLRLAIVDVSYNETLIVIKTIGGLADFVGDYLDAQADSYLLGTISGENTVFATPRETRKIKETFQKICLILNYKKEKK